VKELTGFFKSRWVEVLITGVWLQSVINALFTANITLILLTALGGLALLIVIFVLVSRLSPKPPPPTYDRGEVMEVLRDAVIFTVGGQDETIRFALDSQEPKWLGLICSSRTQEIAQRVIAYSGLDEDHIRSEIVDPWSVPDVRAQTDSLLSWLQRNGVAKERIVVDFTGGTAIMSAGAYSQAIENRVDTQYIRSDYNERFDVEKNTQRGVPGERLADGLGSEAGESSVEHRA
jgi:hypothetical protein